MTIYFLLQLLVTPLLVFLKPNERYIYKISIVFSHDVTTSMLVSQNKEMAAMLVSQTKPLGIELYFYANTYFCSVNQYGQ